MVSPITSLLLGPTMYLFCVCIYGNEKGDEMNMKSKFSAPINSVASMDKNFVLLSKSGLILSRKGENTLENSSFEGNRFFVAMGMWDVNK